MQLLHCEAMTISNTTSEQIATRPRVLSGMRPTGRLHLGNYMGALYNWVQLQHQYECYFFVADWHALTTDYADTSNLDQNIDEVLLDFLAARLYPKQCTLSTQPVSIAGISVSELGSMKTLSGTRTEVMLFTTSVAARAISVERSRPSATAAVVARKSACWVMALSSWVLDPIRVE